MAGWTCAGCTTTYTVGAAHCPQCGSTERTDGRGGSVLPSMTVACGNGNCRYAGQERRVHLRTAAPGVLELPRLVCAGCGFDMPAEAPWPPVNDSENNAMPKNTVHGGPSNRFAEPETAGVVTEPPATAAPAPEVDEGGEQSSPGKSSSPSTEKPPTNSEPSGPVPQRRARMTASRSKKARTGSSSAASTDGDQAADTSASEESGS